MRNLPALFVAALVALNMTAIAQPPPGGGPPPGSLWYNGDWDGVNGLANERNTLVTQAAVYDDFSGPTAGQLWNVTAVFSDNLISFNLDGIGADWEIRTGISEGNAGTLVANGTTNSPIVTQLHCSINFCISRVEVTGLNVLLPTLPPGQHYWLNVTPVGPGWGRSFDFTTSGHECVGSPCGNDQNAFFNSTYFGAYFTSTANEFQPYDYSMGVIGSVVPEPATPMLLAYGVGALVILFCRSIKRQKRPNWAMEPTARRFHI